MSILLDLVIIAALCLAILLLTPQLSGWNKLASLYRVQVRPTGECFSVEWAKIGQIYFWLIKVYCSQDGIYLTGSRILRQPPLLIPWSELRNPRKRRLFFMHMEEFDIGSPSVGTLQLRSGIVKHHIQSSNKSLEPTAGRRDDHI
jgi:hypothetical protein